MEDTTSKRLWIFTEATRLGLVFLMEFPTETDSSENLYYSYNATSDFFEFPVSEETRFVETQIQNRWFRAVKFSVNLFLRTSTFSLSTSWDLAKFSLAYLIFLKQKTLALAGFLDESKDRSVRTLMWRRGILFRPATHAGVLAVAAIAVIAGGIFSRPEVEAQNLAANNAVVSSPNIPETIVPVDRPRSDIVTYTVKAGDTLGQVAEKFAVSTDTIKWANNKSGDGINPGEALSIPPVTGVIYKVAAGDSIAAVAGRYSADAQTIADFPFNYIDASLALAPGQTLFIPNGSVPRPVVPTVRRAAPANVAHGSGILAWPTAGTISQYASWFHPAIDIAAPYGTAIYASNDGVVTTATSLATGFGRHVVIDHGSGLSAIYAHMSAYYVKDGDSVKKGQLIGAVGTSGFATGSHLHFQISRDSASVNPMSLLP